MIIRLTISLLLSFFYGFNALTAASFGKNNVQYTYFHWKYLTTEHFNIYYNQGGKEVADFAAEIAERAYSDIARTFLYSSESDDPITIITYQSHNDFEQTNVTGQPDESTGGVTEFLKTRVAVPFQGNHEEFRHVIHHELTHAMMLNMMFGQGLNAIISGIAAARIPLWFVEGLAEYMSRDGIDPETEMILRDAVFNDILPEIRLLDASGYLGVYKCGQSILYWIAWRYGDEKVGEILHQTMRLNDFDRALKASIGMDSKELSKRWRRFIKARYWPQVSEMEAPDVFAQQMTDHEKEYCYVNNSPALSPDGEWLAFLSNRSDYFDIYLMNTIDGEVKKRLVKGQRSGEFEELHWLRPGITWSPDANRIALCAKAGKHDALYIIDIRNGKVTQRFDYVSDGLFSPSWSPDGKHIAMIMFREGESDLVTVELNTGQLTYITSDRFDEADPSWSHDSQRLLFTSNRDGAGLREKSLSARNFVDFNFNDFDVYEVDIRTNNLSRLTNDPFMERTPLWTSLENTLIYVSDKSGVFNIYQHNLESGQSSAITNIVTGAFQPTIAREIGTLAFASYFNNGYDIFLMNDPFGGDSTAKPYQISEAEKILSKDSGTSRYGTSPFDYQHYVFDRLLQDRTEEEQKAKDSTEIVVRERQIDGTYPSKEYRVQLEPDLVFVYASYSPYYAMQGSGLILLTDILGNHQMFVSAELNYSIKYSNLFFLYNYMAKRMDIGCGTYHHAYPFYSSYNDAIWLDRNYGLFLTTSYPFNHFNRLEVGLDYSIIERTTEWQSRPAAGEEYTLSTVLPHVGYVHDTSIHRWSTSPANGDRWRADLLWSPNVAIAGDKSISFTTVSFDWRKYLAYHKDYTFGFRLSGAISEGTNPQRFFMGGLMNWFNARYDNPSGDVQLEIEDIYFARFVTPLRGVGYYNQIGTRYILGNFEFRYPFIRHLVLGWPLPFYFRNVRGAFFTDVGTTWCPKNIGKNLVPDPSDWLSGFGFGIRMDLGVFPIEWDIAWSPETGMVPQYYFSLNFGF